MKRYSWLDDAAINEMSAILRRGGVLVGSSDTVFGLIAPVTDSGKKRLDEIKGRQDKPYLVLAGSIDSVRKLVDPSQLLQVEKLLEQCWPGPLTVIFNTSPKAEELFCAPFPSIPEKKWTIAIRVPSHAGLQKLLAHTGLLFSTSANKSGEPVPMTLDQMDQSILNQVDGVVMDADEQASTLSMPSTIIDATGDKLIMVREGAFARAELESKLGEDGKQF